ILGRDQRAHVVFPAIGRQIDAAILVTVTRGEGNYFDRPAGAARDQLAIRLKQPYHAAADDADPGERDTQRRAGSGGGGRWRHAGTPVRQCGRRPRVRAHLSAFWTDTSPAGLRRGQARLYPLGGVRVRVQSPSAPSTTA